VPEDSGVADHYSAHYRDFAEDVYGDVRRAAFGEDIGQNSWLTADELARFVAQLELSREARLLDVACGSGGPALHIAMSAGCGVVGVDLYEEAVANGARMARESGLEKRAVFLQADAGRVLPLKGKAFHAIICVDAVHHLGDRAMVIADWARLLRSGGRLLFTDPVTVTGALEETEVAVRTSIGPFVFSDAGENERMLAEAGLDVVAVQDTTNDLATVARRRWQGRADRAGELRQLEGEEAFDGRQRFFAMVATLAEERRLSRFAYLAEKPE
jgi:SAM-dependent methyltransferase